MPSRVGFVGYSRCLQSQDETSSFIVTRLLGVRHLVLNQRFNFLIAESHLIQERQIN